ncbi:hypothetical protein LNAOJCKE_1378 [Methylorubrum aminovorans]|uniref:Uncharacterized protein n=1 Tax=Methylorubrum aminovorans TaxID=269069 RepID=A0ABQ4UCI3_9HYPH|nr:hypothetical protein LNAOJCKE_1378 [Methylorubrum aminovorans]
MNAHAVDIRNAVADDPAQTCQFIPGPLQLSGWPLAYLG